MDVKRVLMLGPGGNYLPKIVELMKSIPPGAIGDVHIFHDDACATLRDPAVPCDCDPDVKLEMRSGP